MGMCLDPMPAMGDFSTEVRRESFWLRGVEVYTGDHGAEFMLADIPKIKAAIAQVERYLKSR